MAISSEPTKPNANIQAILSDIEKIKLEKVSNKDFVDQDVYLDGREFINCLFKNCTLHVKLGHFRIGGRRIHLEDCNFRLYPPAESVKSIFDLLALRVLQKKK